MTTFPSKPGQKRHCSWTCNLSGSSEIGADCERMFEETFYTVSLEVEALWLS